MIRIESRYLENGVIEEVFYCEKCGKVIAKRYVAESGEQVSPYTPCEHFKLVEIGNACTPWSTYYDKEICGEEKEVKELFEKADLVLSDGSTYYLYIPV